MDIVEGDRIQVVKDTQYRIPKPAKKYLGTVMTVAKVCNFDTYKMVEDKSRWVWDESVFEFKVDLHGLEKRKMLWDKLLKLTREEDNY